MVNPMLTIQSVVNLAEIRKKEFGKNWKKVLSPCISPLIDRLTKTARKQTINRYANRSFMFEEELVDETIVTMYSDDGISTLINELQIAQTMEVNKTLLDEINKEVEISRNILQEMSNDCLAIQEFLEPQLTTAIKRLRETRMTIKTEFSQTLNAMKDVRKFFLDKEYEKEMDRLERFVNIVSQFRELSADGTLDAVSDTILKLSEGDNK